MTQDQPDQPAQIDTSVASIARIYDYWLGGKDNFKADRGPALRQLSTRMGGTRAVPRSHQEVSRFFDGLEMVEPGLVQLHRWRPGTGLDDTGRDLAAYGAVARKP